jgi:hypothetical protein
MSKAALDNLVKIERLKAEPPTKSEYEGMLTAARSRLTRNTKTSIQTAASISLMVRRTGWLWPRCGAKAIIRIRPVTDQYAREMHASLAFR